MEIDPETVWWRCAYYAYLDSDQALDRADEENARAKAVEALADTVEGFLEGRLNFGTLKYRMDNASAESGSVFPPRSVCSVLSDLALGVPVDDLEAALRRAARLPEDLGEAKGALMDLEEAMEREVSKGHLKKAQARPERWAEVLACLWHIQDPQEWPFLDTAAMRYLREKGEVDPTDPIQGYAEYAGCLKRLTDRTGGDMSLLARLLAALGSGELQVPGAEECFERTMAGAREMDRAGQGDRALELYERALTLRPRTPEALMRKAALYEAKGLIMAAIGEMETLVEIAPNDLPAHRALITLYKSQKMVREHNIEVRRFRAVMGK
ncbi:MAG: tetratricopeptide repeat protein [Candidatus Saccharibacteria bacterium]